MYGDAAGFVVDKLIQGRIHELESQVTAQVKHQAALQAVIADVDQLRLAGKAKPPDCMEFKSQWQHSRAKEVRASRTGPLVPEGGCLQLTDANDTVVLQKLLACPLLTRVHLGNPQLLTDNSISAVIQQCPFLVEFCASSLPSTVTRAVTGSAIVELARYCSLTRLEIPHFEQVLNLLNSAG
eukprot:TRINITY_DN15073_c0_g1_i2.p2 TRINITY_DN15073_c0_g1~~TRINITY_DN15073_c0_g1_i2.p2  ORF type:complete len:182 (+),score=21.17 TRINITY_DN15073_c0_g1_i2:40-585(+)